jgi:hypothetical protein
MEFLRKGLVNEVLSIFLRSQKREVSCPSGREKSREED